MTKKNLETQPESNNTDRKNLCFRAENLAVPEVITDEKANPDLEEWGDLTEEELEKELEEIQYETLAIPEVHFSRRKAK